MSLPWLDQISNLLIYLPLFLRTGRFRIYATITQVYLISPLFFIHIWPLGKTKSICIIYYYLKFSLEVIVITMVHSNVSLQFSTRWHFDMITFLDGSVPHVLTIINVQFLINYINTTSFSTFSKLLVNIFIMYHYQIQ